MRKIYIFRNGGASLIEENSGHYPTFNGEDAIQIVDPTPENMKKYFYTKPDKKITIKT